jgi:hypothetical protein
VKIVDGLYIPEKHTIIPGRPLWPNIGRLPRLPRPDLPPFWELAIAPRAGGTVVANSAGPIGTNGFNCQVNDLIVVTIEIRTVASQGVTITDTIGTNYSIVPITINNGTVARTEVWWVFSTGSNTTNVVTVTLTATSKFTVCAESYSGVTSVGNTSTNTGTSATPAVTLTTQDPNNWIAMGAAAQGIGAITATSPNVVQQSRQTSGGSAGTNVSGAEGDAGAFATAGSHTVTFAVTSAAWATAGIELRSVAAATERHQTRHIRTVMGFH